MEGFEVSTKNYLHETVEDSREVYMTQLKGYDLSRCCINHGLYSEFSEDFFTRTFVRAL